VSDLVSQLTSALADRYRIERELGQGGMATVYLAEDVRHRRKVAVKVLRPELSAALGPERFLREIETTANLRHPHILPLYDSGAAAEFLFYVMPLVEGESLRDRITRERQLPIDDALGIAREVADALGYAHSRGIIHRDIKPENILLEGGHAVVADFGIARALSAAGGEQLTRTGMSIGTPSYMSPEQAAGEQNLDGRSDLYALGCVLFEMLGGQPPFTGPTVESVVHQHLMVEPPPITNLRPTVPAAVAGALARTLAKAPADRFNPAAQFVQALSPASIAGTVPQQVPASTAEPRARWIATGLAALLLAAAGAGYVLTRDAMPAVLLEPKRVVVATFENKSGDPALDPLGAMAADWIARGLIGTGLVDVGGTSADLAARGVTASAHPGHSAIQALARNANAGLVISGAYYAQGDSVLFQADFTDANAGTLVQTVGPVAARASAPLEGVERLRQRVIGGLGPLVDASLLSLGSVLSRPPSLEAYREFLAGQDLFYRSEAEAVEHFSRAAAADSTYQVPLLWSLVLLHNMGDGRRSDSLIRLLEGRRERMTPYEQVYLDYARCRSSPGLATCVPSTEALLRLTPKSQFVRYLNGIMLRWVNRPRAADSVFRGVDPLSGEMRGRIYYVTHHAGSLHALGEYERELAVVRQGQVQYPGRQVLAFTNIRPLVALGRLEEVDRALGEALRLPRDLRVSAALTGAMTVYELRWHGHTGAADSLGTRLLTWLDARPAAEAETERGRHDRAVLLMATRRWRELEAVTDSMAPGDPGNVEVLRLRGVALAMQGQRAAAEAIEQALERDTRPIRPVDQCAFWAVCRRVARAYIAAALGDQARAITLTDGWPFRYDTEAHFDLLGELLREYAPFQALARPAG
jgi:tRNA A-37 threonylcarbamoyl transferase component Bud32